jgi:quercetin dioxygenase-like cupin family protein
LDGVTGRGRQQSLSLRCSFAILKRIALPQAKLEERDLMAGRTGEQASGQGGFSGVTRRVLERLPLPGDGRELFVVEVTYPPGGAAPLHRHPVGGAIYIVEGVAESAYGHEPPRRYQAGDTLQDRADIPHTLFRNCDPDRPLRFLTIYALEPGRPYTLES